MSSSRARPMMVFVTAPDETVAEKIARTVVGERLAACVNIVRSIRSIYRWQGKIEDEAEVLLIIKTSEEALPKLQSRVIDIHPYDVPEVLAIQIDDGSPPYLEWLLGAIEAMP